MARIISQKLPFTSLAKSGDGIELDLKPEYLLHKEDAPPTDPESVHTVYADVSKSHDVSRSEVFELHRLFRPVTFMMGCFGVYHPSRFVTSAKAASRELRQTYFVRYLTIILALCNFGFLISNFIAFVVARPHVDMGILVSIIYVILLVWLAFGSLLTLMHFLIFEDGKVDRIWHLWVEWAERYPYVRNWTGMRMVRNVSLVVACFCTVAPAIIVAVGSARTAPGTWMEEILRKIEYGGIRVNHVWMTIDFTLIVFVVYGTASFTTAFFVVNCHLVTNELQNLHYVIADRLNNGKIWDNIKDATDGQLSELEQLRRRRLQARRMVEEMNSTFKVVAFLSLFANVPLIVFIVYALVLHGDNSPFMMVIGIIATIMSLAQVGFFVVAAAWINQWADRPRGLLHTIRIDDSSKMTRLNSASLTLFLSELSSESIGVTAWGLALITKQFIATVVGLVVTYIIVLLQFHAANSMLTMTQEITSTLTNITVDLNRTKNMVSDSAAEGIKDAYY